MFVFCSWLGFMACQHVGGILLLCREAVGVFYSLSRVGPLVGSILLLPREAVGVFYRLNWLGHLLGRILPLSREALGVFSSPSRLGHSLRESYSSAEKPLVYSTVQVDWITRCRNCTPLKRSSRCIISPPNSQLGHPRLESHHQMHCNTISRKLLFVCVPINPFDVYKSWNLSLFKCH